MRDKPWAEGLEWLAEKTGLPVMGEKPTGTFSYIAPKGQFESNKKTIPEVIDIINENLQVKHFMLIRREASFILVQVDEQGKIPLYRVPRVAVEDLPKHGKSEIVQIIITLASADPEEAARQLQ